MRNLSPAPLRRRPLWACLLSLAVALLTLPTAPAFGQTTTLTVPEDFSIAASSADGIRLVQDAANSSSFTFDDPDSTSFRLTVTNLGDNSLGCAAQIGNAAQGLGPPVGALIPVGSHPITCNILRTPARGTFTLTVTAFVAPPETNNPPVYTGPTTFTVEEGAQIVTLSLMATDANSEDTIAFSVTGGMDMNHLFVTGIPQTQLFFTLPPDFDNPVDANRDNRYQITVTIRSGIGDRIMRITQAITIIVTTARPVYTGQTAYTVVEGTIEVATLTAMDPDAEDTIAYSFSGGADDALFALDPTSGVLAFQSAPAFANPAAADGDNIYEITVDVIGGIGNRALIVERDITIIVTSAFSAGDLHRAILPQVARAMTDSVAAAISGRIRQAAEGAASTGPAFRLGGAATTLHDALAATAGPALRLGGNETRYDALAATAGPAFRLGDNEMRYDALTAHAPAAASGALDLPRLLNGSSFLLPLNAADNGAANPGTMAFWGRGGYRNLEGDGALNWDGGLASASIGLDGRPRPDILLGVALSYSDGAFDYDNAGTEGEYDISMTSVHPYLGLSLPHDVSLWATFGYGEGKIEIAPQGGTASSSDAALRSVALGASGQLLSAEGWLNMPGATAVRLKSEASATRIDVKGDATEAADLSVDITRFRLALEGTNERVLANGAIVSPSLELGMRYDGGDGDNGAGLELGGGARYTNPATGLSVGGKARVLVGRDDYDEWGIQGSLAMRPGADGQGLSFSLSPGYGDSGGIQRLWRQGLPEDGDDNAAADYRARLDMRLGYGLSAPGGHGMLTPYSELTLGATNRYRAGINWKAGPRFDLTLLGERREGNSGLAEHAVLLKGEVRF